MMKYINAQVEKYNNLPGQVVVRLYKFMGDVLRTVENKKTSDEQIGYLLEFITFDMIDKYLVSYKENEKLSKIEVIGDNKELNELVMNKILKGK